MNRARNCKGRRDSGGIGILAWRSSALLCALVAVLVALRPTPGSGQIATPAAPRVAYLLRWHANAEGSNTYQDGTFRSLNSRHSAAMSGMAIVRFNETHGHLSYYDTRYLALTVSETSDSLDVIHNARFGDCTSLTSDVLIDKGTYSGLHAANTTQQYALLEGPALEAGRGAVIHQPFQGLASMRFLMHLSTTQSGYCHESVSRDHMAQSFLTGLGDRRELVLSADPGDAGSYALDTQFTASGPAGPNTVHWTARAVRMGKCAQQEAPIQDGDPVVQNEDVDIDTKAAEIQPDESTEVHVTITCDRVPIKAAEVELTIQPQDRSGGHLHTNSRPRGSLNGTELTNAKPSITVKTDASGKLTVKFEPPEKHGSAGSKTGRISGLYTIIASSKRFPDRSARAGISVRRQGLAELLEGLTAYYIVSAPQHGRHTVGTYGTPGTLAAFQNLAEDFYKAQARHNDELRTCNRPPWGVVEEQEDGTKPVLPVKVSFNDIALSGGGKFDWKGDWTGSHQTHGAGQGGDLNHFFQAGTRDECNGTHVNFDNWLKHVLFEIGNGYGHWDRLDLGMGANQIPTLAAFSNADSKWHLHVED